MINVPDMNSWQCIMRHNIIDTPWFHCVYLIAFILLFAHKQRLATIALAIVLMSFIHISIKGCMASIGAFTSITVTNWIIIILSVMILLSLSFFEFHNTYVTYFVNFLVIYLVIEMNLIGIY